jgi:hypothetical protein
MEDVEARKRAAYWKGWNSFWAVPIIPMSLQIIVKPDEKQYKGKNYLFTKEDFEDFKARNIFNPSDQVKSVLGYVMSEIMHCLKKTPVLKSHFVQGWTSEQLEDEVYLAWNKMKDPVAFSYDGGNHDAHQHSDFITEVDNYFLEKIGVMVCADLGFNLDQVKEIMAKLLMVNCPVHLFAPKELTGMTLLGANRIKVLSGVLNGTVFSGHPSRTTFGNTLRILMLLMVICDDIGCKFGIDVHPFQAGDDTYIIIEREWLDRFRDQLLVYYSEVEGVTHGYGQLMKDFQVLGNKVDFLSKVGVVNSDRALIFRNPRRLFATGTISTSIGKTMTVPQYNYAITGSLQASYAGFPGMDKLISRRKRELSHEYTKKKDFVYEVVKEVHHGKVDWHELGVHERSFKMLDVFDGDVVAALIHVV